MRRFVLAVLLLATTPAFAVSDGQYRPANQGCTGSADNASAPQHTDTNYQDVTQHCHSAIVTISDASGHQYFGWGLDQTKEGESAHSGEVWAETGDGLRYVYVFNSESLGRLPGLFGQAGTPADPASGLSVYIGADDNVANGEHDSSSQVSNGPSDGGAIRIDVKPSAASALIGAIARFSTAMSAGAATDVAGAGLGACADGLCFAITTQRRLAFSGGGPGERDVFDYDGVAWDPYGCTGPTDTVADCGGFSLRDWWLSARSAFTEPGVQIYEDPDPQASPRIFGGGDPYPIPALYAGLCGVVIGGGQGSFPSGPFVNDAGQLEVRSPLCA